MLVKYYCQYSYSGDGGGDCPKSTVFTSLSGDLLLQVWSSDQHESLLDAESQLCSNPAEFESIFSQNHWITHVDIKG